MNALTFLFTCKPYPVPIIPQEKVTQDELTKHCNRCGETKDKSEFKLIPNKNGKKYISSHCKRCAVDISNECNKRRRLKLQGAKYA